MNGVPNFSAPYHYGLVCIFIVAFFATPVDAKDDSASAPTSLPESQRPRLVTYDKPVRMAGVIYFEYACVDTDFSPTRDPEAAAQQAAEAKKTLPRSDWWRWDPHPIAILRLDQPISVAKGGDEFTPAETDVREVALSVSKTTRRQGRCVVLGKLWHASTTHHLRPIMVDVISLKPSSRK